jgi:hypothetical protein
MQNPRLVVSPGPGIRGWTNGPPGATLRLRLTSQPGFLRARLAFLIGARVPDRAQLAPTGVRLVGPFVSPPHTMLPADAARAAWPPCAARAAQPPGKIRRGS